MSVILLYDSGSERQCTYLQDTFDAPTNAIKTLRQALHVHVPSKTHINQSSDWPK